MEEVIEIPNQNAEKIIDKIQNIFLDKSMVSDENDFNYSEATQETSDQRIQVDIPAGDENDNKVNIIRKDAFYKDAQNYWKSIPATVDGMLGGFSSINFTDIRGSQDFVNDVFKMKPSPNKNFALDCGAGIGRITKHLLLPIFNVVDVVEQDENFANAVKDYVGNSTRLGTVYNQGLQEFQPKSMKYDVIWCQWVLGHLTNDDFVKFFQRCVHALNKNGVIIVKENVTSTNDIDIDEVDSSMTRPLAMLKAMLVESGLRIIKMVKQSNFPSVIFPVYMFALKPVKRNG